MICINMLCTVLFTVSLFLRLVQVIQKASRQATIYCRIVHTLCWNLSHECDHLLLFAAQNEWIKKTMYNERLQKCTLETTAKRNFVLSSSILIWLRCFCSFDLCKYSDSNVYFTSWTFFFALYILSSWKKTLSSCWFICSTLLFKHSFFCVLSSFFFLVISL